jgi:phosphopantetheine--protein transferase-like protein
MILGTGIDSVEIARVADKCADGAHHFAERLFTTLERARAARYKLQPYQHLAACFAAREAFFKATQIHYEYDGVSVTQYPSGQPYYLLKAEIAQKLDLLVTEPGRKIRLHLALTHDQTHATAICICEEL